MKKKELKMKFSDKIERLKDYKYLARAVKNQPSQVTSRIKRAYIKNNILYIELNIAYENDEGDYFDDVIYTYSKPIKDLKIQNNIEEEFIFEKYEITDLFDFVLDKLYNPDFEVVANRLIKECYISPDNEYIIKLPNFQMPSEVYQIIKKKLNKIGGKWIGGKIQGFKFDFAPRLLLEDIKNGKDINLKKDYQFYATPQKIANEMVEKLELKDNVSILEPSAGRGNLIKSIPNNDTYEVYYFELMPQNLELLEKNLKNKEFKKLEFLGTDFLEYNGNMKFDRIIANPPFSKNQDIIHTKKMFELLNDNGVMVVITSTSWYNGKQKKQIEFKEWLNSIKHDIIFIDSGSFKESGTNVKTIMLKIKKG